MSTTPRICSECSAPLSGRRSNARTCSAKCRRARSERQARENKRRLEEQIEAEAPSAAKREISDIVRRHAPDVVHRILGDELKPIVREAVTEDVFRAINELVGLTPLAVQAISEDLQSEDPTIRQRAYSLLVKYTIGHQALVRPADAEPNGQVVVNFNLPRPEAEEVPALEAAAPAEAEEMGNCDMCDRELPVSEFVAGSRRCPACFEEWQQKIEELYS